MCSFERNRKGIVGTTVGPQMLFIGAMFTRVSASAPSLVCSMVSFSLPSAALLKTLIDSRPWVAFDNCWLMYFTASTVG